MHDHLARPGSTQYRPIGKCLASLSERTETSSLTISIPEPYRQAVAAIAESDPASRQALLDALDSAPSTSSMQQLQTHIGSATEIPPRAIKAALSVTASLIGTETTADDDRRAVAEGVADDAVRRGLGGLVSEDPAAIQSFAEFLFALMERKSVVGVAADVASLLYDHKNLYRDARILTDFRPMFDDAQQPTALRAGVIFHTLRLTMISPGGDDAYLYVALDTRDLLSLRSALDRAIAKDRLLRENLSALDLPVNDASE